MIKYDPFSYFFNLAAKSLILITALVALIYFSGAFAQVPGSNQIDIAWTQSRHQGKSVLTVIYRRQVYSFLVEDSAKEDPKFIEAIVDKIFELDEKE